MRHMSKILYDAPANLRTRLGRNLPDVAAVWNAQAAKVLGVQGSKTNRSRPGEPPRRQTGGLIAQTKAIPAASSLTIQIVTSEVGKYLNNGTRRMARRPFVNLITRQAAPAMKVALHKP